MITEKYSTNLVKTKYVNDSKITDHYAIIPTGQGYENYDTLPELHKRVYKIITKRFLAIFYPPAEYNKINVTVEIEKEAFNATGKVCTVRGYLDVLKPIKEKQEEKTEDDKNEDENTNLDILNTLKKGQRVEINNFENKEENAKEPFLKNVPCSFVILKSGLNV